MSEEKMREKFERVVESKFGFDDNDFYFDETDSTYNDPDLNDLWIVYQAALQESEAGAVYQRQFIPGNWKDVTEEEFNLLPDFYPRRIVYPAPQSAQAIETAAIIKCVEVVRSLGGVNDSAFVEAFLALIPQDGRTALFDMCMEAVAKGDEYGRRMESENEFSNPSDLRAIVTNLLGAAK